MNALLRRLFDVRPGEEARVALMFAYSFLVIASLSIVKPVRTSLLLIEHGPETLPYMFLLIALLTPLFVLVYNKISRRVRLNRLIALTTLASMAIFGVIWLLLSFEYHAAWFIYAFYVWVTIFGLIATTQFWLLANYVFNAREAKRLFSVIGSGAIAGGIVGGYLTSALTSALHVAGMLLFTFLFLALCLALQYALWQRSARASYSERLSRQERQRSLFDESSPWTLLLQSRLVPYLAGIVGIGVLAGTLIDYQFSVMAAANIRDSDEMTAFFGFWMSNLSIASFLIQIFGTSRILRTLGVNTALMFLPLIVVLGAGILMLIPTLGAAAALKVGEGGLKQSLHKAGLELLGVPVPARLKNRIKALIDVAIDNFATGLAGVTILVLLFFNLAGAREMAAVILTLGVVWLFLVYRSRADYLDAFRKAIEKRSIRAEDISYEIYSTLRADHLITLLSSKNDRQILMALRYLDTMGDKRLAGHLTSLAESTSSEVLISVLRIGRSMPTIDLCDQATRLQAHARADVRVSATRYLLRRSEDKAASVRALLSHEDEQVRAATIVAAAKEWRADADFRSAVDWHSMLKSLCSELSYDSKAFGRRRAIAEALSITAHSDHAECIEALLDGDDHDAAGFAAISAGRTRDERFVDALIRQLNLKQRRKATREALAEYGDAISERLAAMLRDPRTPNRLHIEIPRVLAMIGTPRSFALLSDNMGVQDSWRRSEIVRAMNKMRKRDGQLRLRSRKVDPVIWDEIRDYYRLVQVLDCVARHAEADRFKAPRWQEVQARQLLMRAVKEKLQDKIDLIFRLLALKYLVKDIYHAYLGITTGGADHRANAVELLELVLKPDMKAALIPIAEGLEYDILTRIGAELFGGSYHSETGALNALLEGNDDWLRTMALYMRWYSSTEHDSLDCKQFESHSNAIVRETARAAGRVTLTGSEIC